VKLDRADGSRMRQIVIEADVFSTLLPFGLEDVVIVKGCDSGYSLSVNMWSVKSEDRTL
jgi:hypothetical protein